MCDIGSAAAEGWKGWLDLPASRPGEPYGAWTDLSHPLGASTPLPQVPPEQMATGKYGFPSPIVERYREMPEFPANITRIDMIVHVGTHVDAPNHFIADGPEFHEIPMERLYGIGRVAKMTCEEYQIISGSDLEMACPNLERGDILALDTGWSAHAGTELYDRHPSLDKEAALWLLDRGIKMLAVDFPSPDLPIAKRAAGFTWPVHHVLLANGILVTENLKFESSQQAGTYEFVFAALNIEKGDGAPVRGLCRPIEVDSSAAGYGQN